MKSILDLYVKKFNSNDNEGYKQTIENKDAKQWMETNIPLIEIPDKNLEEIYYFRWWVFRKHIKNTEDGYVITEFLPPVRWGGTHNTIIAATGHHISEAKWLKNNKEIIEDYIKFWLDEKSKTYLYSSWILYSIYEYCLHTNDFSFGIDNLDLMIRYYETTYSEHITESGLFWSVDNNDAMEVSISGTNEDFKRSRGIRPTLNSYMAANAWAISEFAKKAEKLTIAEKYRQEYERIREKIIDIMWDGDFFKAIHIENLNNPSIDKIPQRQNVKELIGYIPWCFNLPPTGFECAFEELKKKNGFCSKYGLTTAEQRHPRYLYEHKKAVCLWNGYIWPYATSQTLNAVINLLNNYKQDVITDSDFYEMLSVYADSQYITTENGDRICWIDEVKDPRTNEWSSRKILKEWGWPEEFGGYERGKDYNHSSYCDIILGGLLGITSKNGVVSVNPHIPENWEYFLVENFWVKDRCYKIVYDKTGEKYNLGKGLHILMPNI